MFRIIEIIVIGIIMNYDNCLEKEVITWIILLNNSERLVFKNEVKLGIFLKQSIWFR